MTAAPSLDDYLVKDVAAFLATRVGPELLGKPAKDLLIEKLNYDGTLPPEEQAAIAALQQEFDRFTAKDMGVLAFLTNEYFQYRDQEFGVRGTSVLLRDGLAAWKTVATLIGTWHRSGGAIGPTRHMVKQNVARLHAVIDEATAASEEVVLALVNANIALEVERLEGLMQETIAAEREQMTAAADSAQREATALRRERDALQTEVKRLDQQLKKLEYDTQKAARQRSDDQTALPALQAEVEHLQGQVRWLTAERQAEAQQHAARVRELERLLDEATAPVISPAPIHSPAPTPLEAPMTSPAPLKPALAAQSFVVFLRSKGHHAQTDHGCVIHKLSKAEYQRLDAEWRKAIPDEAAALAQLRAVVHPILRRAV